ncbi:VOC family protein [Caldovatus aquaticus]|uniref:VOC family protein n=1 Tax=Caldovatus aquaticus TaxID=2865671 RepID=A0ABS7F290_9PROT|nr:VOC family protein [Caldovatus aquaticus]MBW8269614.1 VOC family protein [Caldovatus aquaticus]
MSTVLALDHVGVAARDLAPLAAAYERLGFTLTPVAQQSGRRRPDLPVERFGTGNRCAFLRHGYVELIAILDPALHDNGLGAFLARYQGMHILALAMADEQANLARLRRAGVPIPGVAYLERPVEEGGPVARFARLPFPDAPEGRIQLIRHLTPELLWQERWMDHANRAVALEAAILVAAAPAESAARLSRLAGLPVEPDPAGGFALALPGAAGAAGPRAPAMETRVRILTPEGLARVLPGMAPPALPAMAGMVLRTADGNAAVRRLLAGLPLRAAPEAAAGGLMVPPEHAGGAAVVFAPA